MGGTAIPKIKRGMGFPKNGVLQLPIEQVINLRSISFLKHQIQIVTSHAVEFFFTVSFQPNTRNHLVKAILFPMQ